MQERIGLCLQRAAYQSKTDKEFTDRIGPAQESYKKAGELYGKTKHPSSKARRLHCQAQSTHLESWIMEDPQKRKDCLDRCLEADRKALKEWSRIGDTSGYLETCNGFLSHLYSRSELIRDYEEVTGILEEAIKFSEAAYKAAGGQEDAPELALTRHLLSLILLDKPMEVYGSIKKQQDFMKTSFETAQRAYEDAERLGDPYLVGRSGGVLSYVTFERNGDLEASLKLANTQLESADKTGDTLLKAQAYELLGYLTAWKTNTTDEDPETQVSENEKAYQYTENAIKLYEAISRPITLAYINHVGSHYHLARNESTTETKLKIYRKGVAVAKIDLENAHRYGSQLGTLYILNELSHLLLGLIRYERVEEDKRRLIEEATSTVDELIEVSTRVQPFRYWNHSVFKFQSAKLKIEYSRIEKDQEKRVTLLKEALQEGEECAELGKIHLETNPSRALSLDYAVGLRQMGELLEYLYAATKDTQYLDQATGIYREMRETYQENELLSRVAETHWKTANIKNRLGQYTESAEEFEQAAQCYEDAAKKIPHLKEFYTEYSNYMRAWSEIKKAKQHNLEKEYGKVKEHYEKAAELHGLTSRWGYLSNNYSAWARLAEAEALSQDDKTEDASNLFGEVAELFEESRKVIEGQIDSIGVRDEQELARSLIEASRLRHDYCVSRMTLEEARILNRRGEHAASSRKYNEAASILQRIVNALDMDAERNEITPIITLCKAWRMMTLAEADAAPRHYHEAAQLFEEAKDLSLTQQTKLLSLGHSNFCRALYECTQFETTRDVGSYQKASQYLTNATNYYVRAGYEPALEYSKATQRLFDAYVYVDNANAETEPEKKARYYAMAERVLEASAKSFLRAKHPAKEQEVYRLLENIRKDRTLVMALIDVLNAPLISSSTESFSAPTPSHEYAAGLESFEHANVQASLYLKSTDVKSGEAFDAIVELYNAGMASATLVKVEDIVPENFEVVRVSGYFGAADGYIDLKGKRLGPLSTEEIQLSMKPLSKGSYTLKSCVVYLDDTGELKHCESEPVEVSVYEMGILGWLRGPRP
ncbi:MAG: hypothetical protein ABIJ47_16075 [Candidatus Bathyarchaeota archaeon]